MKKNPNCELLYDKRKKSRILSFLIAIPLCPLGLQYLYIGGDEKKGCYAMLVLSLFVLVSQGNVGNPFTQLLYIGASILSLLSTFASVNRRNREIKDEVYREFE